MSLESALGSHAAPVTLEFRGKTYHLRPLKAERLTELSRWMQEREATARLDSDLALVASGRMTEEKAFARRDAFIDEAVNDGRYSFGGERMQKVFTALESIIRLTKAKDAGELSPEQIKESERELKAHNQRIAEPLCKMMAIIVGCDMDTIILMRQEIEAELSRKVMMVMEEGSPKGQGAGPAVRLAQ